MTTTTVKCSVFVRHRKGVGLGESEGVIRGIKPETMIFVAFLVVKFVIRFYRCFIYFEIYWVFCSRTWGNSYVFFF